MKDYTVKVTAVIEIEVEDSKNKDEAIDRARWEIDGLESWDHWEIEAHETTN